MNFQEKYNREMFLDFLKVLLPNDFLIKEDDVFLHKKFDKIKKVIELGDVGTLKAGGQSLKVYEAEHELESDPRITLTREFFDIMRDKSTTRALVIFYSKKSKNYRFFLMTVDFIADEKKVKKDFSNPRRYSFYLGEDAKVYTPRKFLIENGKVKNLEDLISRFDIEVVTEEFYKEIANWYFWANRNVDFPDDAEKEKNGRQIAVIRLITRLIFIWFMKQKSLVPDYFFNESELSNILNNLSDKESSYYRTILQNLFFATLNTPIEKRRFRQSKNYKGINNDYGNHEFYRYEECFNKPKEIINLFNGIPFLNGGLFECLDKKREKIIIDGFSRIKKNQPQVPNYLFFANEQTIDLNKEYGTKNKRYKVCGLFQTLNRYNFTIDESTPIDIEISLDPELLGRVFEKLLANYNPETATTARKSTGSYYTPRVIVDYMVDQSLKEYFKTHLSSFCHSEQGEESLDNKLNNLFSYSEEGYQFNSNEINILIRAINELKIIDPAVGSGAFPMGALQKLVFVLSKLDPHNKKWMQEQIKAIEKNVSDVVLKRKLIKKTQDNFENNELDYGRKLYLIQNCIYGVDIQLIAIQIAKLRFFISLLVDEKSNKNKEENFGIEPLPNLETKFIAANSLIGLQNSGQMTLEAPCVVGLKKELKEIRDKHFNANYKREKDKLRKDDKKLRQQIAGELKRTGFSAEDTKKITDWDPYNSNIASEWFDPEWMFGIKDGFDIVIGNPPYIRIYRGNIDKKILEYLKGNYKSAYKKFDLYVIFMEKGIHLLKNKGLISYIVPDKWLSQPYGEMIRNIILSDTSIKFLMDLTNIKVFKSSTVDNYVFNIQKGVNLENCLRVIKCDKNFQISNFQVRTIKQSKLEMDKPFNLFIEKEDFAILEKIMINSIELSKICYVNWGCRPTPKERYVSDSKINEKYKPLVVGKNINRYYVSKNYRWVKYEKNMYNPMFKELFENETIMFKDIIGKGNIVAGLNNKNYYSDFTVINAIKWEKIIQLNLRQIKLPKEVKKYSTLDNLYLLSIVNSKVTSFYFNKLMRSGLHALPNNVKKLPIPIVNKEKQKPFIKLVDKILAITRNDDYLQNKTKQKKVKEYETQIDKMVYKLYDLNEKEIKTVENFK